MNLKKKIKIGSRYWILCPYHKEKNPSMLINKNYLYCFGCNKYIKKNFKIEKEIVKISKYSLKNKDFKKYVKNRGYKCIKIFKKFNVFLLNKKLFEKFFFLKKYMFYNENDLFCIPIKNEIGKIIIFCIRKIKKEKNKYFFSKKICNFKKKEIIYGYYENYKKKKKNIYIVEGFFDLYRLYYIGIRNIFALMGNNISYYILKKLLIKKKKIYLILDNDEAGINSYVKISKLYYKLIYKNFFICFIKKDPDLFFMNYDKKKFKIYIKNNNISIMDFIIKKKLLNKKTKIFLYEKFVKIFKISKQKNIYKKFFFKKKIKVNNKLKNLLLKLKNNYNNIIKKKLMNFIIKNKIFIKNYIKFYNKIFIK
ncbi:toprim domain-containing protein [Candidatus Vidania fulgoroideorum]